MYFARRSLSIRFLAGTALGFAVVFLHVLFAVVPLRMGISGFKANPGNFSPYYHWIMGDTFWSLVFSLLLPFMAALGNSQMTYEDADSGFLMHILQIRGRAGYAVFSLVSVCVSAFLSTVLVLLTDVLLTFSLLPDVRPDQVLNSSEGYSCLFTYHVEWMYSDPWKLVFFYIILAGCVTSLFAMMTAVCGLYFKNRFTVMFSGFLLGMVFFVLANQQIVSVPSFLLVLPVMSQMYLPSFGTLCAWYLGCFALLFCLQLLGVKRHADI